MAGERVKDGRLLRARCERPRDRAAEQRDERAPFQLIELHSVPCQPGPDCRDSGETFEGVTCLACRQVRMVNPRTGKVLGADEVSRHA